MCNIIDIVECETTLHKKKKSKLRANLNGSLPLLKNYLIIYLLRINESLLLTYEYDHKISCPNLIDMI